MIRSAVGFSVVVVALISLLVAVLDSFGQDQELSKRSRFMRMKLEHSQNVLEGLTREDYALISRNAKSLKLLSEAAEWEVPTIPNAEQYIASTTEFQRLCDELSAQAKGRNIDGATLAYVKLTTNCVNCHKYSRAAKE